MMLQIVFCLYLANTILLVFHGMDSAHWKEWDLFGLPGGIGGFLLVHFPLYAVALYGLVPAWEGAAAGRILSLVIAAAGISAFGIHQYFLRKGRPEFTTPASKRLLRLVPAVAIIRAAATACTWVSA
jgi:hypothetical protein